MAMNEKVELATLANNVKKKVNGLIGVYALLIIGTILLFLIVTLSFASFCTNKS